MKVHHQKIRERPFSKKPIRSTGFRNEMALFETVRYISTNEAIWRTFGFTIHERYSRMVHHSFHLEKKIANLLNRRQLHWKSSCPGEDRSHSLPLPKQIRLLRKVCFVLWTATPLLSMESIIFSVDTMKTRLAYVQRQHNRTRLHSSSLELRMFPSAGLTSCN